MALLCRLYRLRQYEVLFFDISIIFAILTQLPGGSVGSGGLKIVRGAEAPLGTLISEPMFDV